MGGTVVLKLDDKKAVVAEVSEIVSKAQSVIAADYRGLTVSEMTRLRSQARQNGIKVCVVRNTLARRAFEGTNYECLRDSLVGPIILLFSQEDPGAAARLLKAFLKTTEKLEVKALSLDGKLLSAKDLDSIAALPTRDEALAQLMSVMMAPITQFVRTLAEPATQVVRVINAVGKQKEAA